MPISKSAKKAVRQNKRRRQRNLTVKDRVRKLEKEIRLLLSQKDVEKSRALLPQFFKAIDKAAREKVLAKNKAARKKSRLSRLLQKTKGS